MKVGTAPRARILAGAGQRDAEINEMVLHFGGFAFEKISDALLCELPCDVRAAYLPREGIYLAGNLDPLREPLGRRRRPGEMQGGVSSSRCQLKVVTVRVAGRAN